MVVKMFPGKSTAVNVVFPLKENFSNSENVPTNPMPLHRWDPNAEASASLCINTVIPFMKCGSTTGPKLSKFCTRLPFLQT